jgi:glycosyltransferase involved in cell wall biosynthesis
MKLLVLAQTPPPLHGQSVMVRTLLEGLANRPEFELHHVNLPLSRDAADIGRIRPGKLRTLLQACRRARQLATVHGIDALYYVPAPGKRGALYRDWIAMGLARPAFRRLVLHWHAPGLSDWLQKWASPPERWLTRRLLGRSDLSIVLAGSLRGDAEALEARRIAVVANGIADPCPGFVRPPPADGPWNVLFLGLCSEDKGLFDAAAAVLQASRSVGAAPGAPAFTLTAAGPFPDSATESRFGRLAAEHPTVLRHVGIVTGAEKHALFTRSHVFCLPTRYPHEGQPLVLLEAMAYDLPVVATRWRAIPEMLPSGNPLVTLGEPAALAEAFVALRRDPLPPGVNRARFLACFTQTDHLAALAEALTGVSAAAA